jgi:hypothetical protein
VRSKEAVSRLRDTAMKNKCPVPSMMAQTFIQVNPAFCCLESAREHICSSDLDDVAQLLTCRKGMLLGH